MDDPVRSVVQQLDGLDDPSPRPTDAPASAGIHKLSDQAAILHLVVQGRPTREVVAQIAALLERQVTGSSVAILLLATDGLDVALTAAPSLPRQFRGAIERQAIAQQATVAGSIGHDREVVVTASIALDPSWQPWREQAHAAGLVSSWSIPFIGANQQLLGLVALYFGAPRFPSPKELSALGDATQLAAVAVQDAAGRIVLRAQDRTNSLTGFPNRVVLLERLRIAQSRVTSSHGYFAVIQVAIDGIAQITDALGPSAADEVLRLAAQRLLNVAGTSATVAHIWGVEFAILVEDLRDRDDAMAMAARLGEACREPFDVDGLAVSVGATLGVAAYSHETASAQMLDEEPLRAAGMAREQAEAGGGGIAIFDPVMGNDAVTLAPELRRGIDENELSMAYQPIVELASNTVQRYEALLRWRSPRRGLVPPETFVPVAEQMGLVSDLGRYALREALAELARLHHEDPGLGISVNVSVRQLADEKLPLLLAELIDSYQLPAGSVTLEVTEGVLLSGGAAGWRVLTGLRDIGARIALDDFGTGFSQLSYLRQFWFDEIKIDRSFVKSMMRDVVARAIIVGVIAVAGYTGSEVVAEGVERPEQRAMLLELGCTHGQGFLFGAPGPLPRSR